MSQTGSENLGPGPEEPPPVVPETYAPPGTYGPRVLEDRGKAVASLLLGIVGLFAWVVPCMGLPVTIIGLVLGIVDRNGPGRRVAIIGIILCSIGLAIVLTEMSDFLFLYGLRFGY